MPLPPLYKYLDLRGARLTLENGTFKHAKPSDFNDVEDVTILSIFPCDVEVALDELENNFIDVLLRHLDEPPTCSSPRREQIILIQAALKRNPDAADLLREGSQDQPLYDREQMIRLSEERVRELNEFFQGYRVFCVTTHKNSERMWAEYAENSQGVMVRVEPNRAKDSKFNLFRPVQYEDVRPALYRSTDEFIADGLFGDREARIREIIERIIYTKTRQWEHEAEYRLAIPLAQGEEPWDVLPYHAEELNELYLGAAMNEDDKSEIIKLAIMRNPNIDLSEAITAEDGCIEYVPLKPG